MVIVSKFLNRKKNYQVYVYISQRTTASASSRFFFSPGYHFLYIPRLKKV
jgi:hypothetical protein